MRAKEEEKKWGNVLRKASSLPVVKTSKSKETTSGADMETENRYECKGAIKGKLARLPTGYYTGGGGKGQAVPTRGGKRRSPILEGGRRAMDLVQSLVDRGPSL